MSKHTPGPWEKRYHISERCYSIRGPNGLLIATVWPDNSPVSHSDARLVAKSPEMYDFVETIAEHFTHDTDRDEACRPNCRVCSAIKLLAEIEERT